MLAWIGKIRTDPVEYSDNLAVLDVTGSSEAAHLHVVFSDVLSGLDQRKVKVRRRILDNLQKELESLKSRCQDAVPCYHLDSECRAPLERNALPTSARQPAARIHLAAL